MAKTSPKTPAVVVDNTSQKRDRGRPPGSPNKQKDSNGNKFDYSRFKITFRKPSDFAGFLAGYPDKRALQAYVYRLRPRIDNSLIGVNESAIFTTHNESEMREDYIASVFGRGHYQLKLSDANRQPGQTEVCKVWFEIEDPEVKPPVYDPRTLLVSDPKNQDEVSRLLQTGILIDDGGRIRVRGPQDGPHAAAPVASGPAVPAPQQSGIFGEQHLIAEVFKSLVTRGFQSPGDAVKDTIEVARMLRPETPPVNVEQIVEAVVRRLQPNPQAAGGELGLLETYERVDKFLRRVGGGRDEPVAVTGEVLTDRVAAAAAGDAWAPHVTGILAQIRGLMSEGIVMYNHFRQNQNRAPQTAQPAPGAAPAQRLPEQMSMVERIEEIAMLGFDKMLLGVKGFDFAAYVCNFHPGGLEVYRTLEPAGKDGVIGMASMNPQTLPFVTQHRAQLEEFLSDFFTFDPDGTSEDEVDAEPEPEPVAPPKRRSSAKSV